MKMKIYKGKMIETLYPSGMYEIYSSVDSRFLKFDSLEEAEARIDSDNGGSNDK